MNYEKLGAFYLGKRYDLENGALQEDVILYDSKDLTTHAVIIGMTGSGKTGLGIGLLEEALIDNVPLIAIDPKGDLSNLLLSFPELSADAFRPWINEGEAATAGQSPDEYAAAQAELWRSGLAEWGQSAERVAKLRASVDMAVYTPGSSAGLPVSVLGSFDAPPPEVRDDRDLYREHVASSATGLLALLGVEAEPATSREHTLLATILEHTWSQGEGLDMAGLIGAIQSPPFERVGVMELDTFYPSKDRFALAMKLNTLLASPGFEAWQVGEPLDISRLLTTEDGRPRASIFSVSHLGDSERMFFVSTLLNKLLGWTRSQSGTSSLRAIFYMDEIFGYLPPTANPPSKTPMLTLLKQARAYGLGLVLATQNPVDLDYKALSNAGTWFIGRLQTERDKERVLEGLQGASEASLDRSDIAEVLSGLGKRVFLLHNVHEAQPVVFQTRWALSYLSGPMTREQIKRLMAAKKKALAESEEPALPSKVETKASSEAPQGDSPPVTPPDVPVYYARASGSGADVLYYPTVAGLSEVHYSSAAHKVSETVPLTLVCDIEDGVVAVDWDQAEVVQLDTGSLSKTPLEGAQFGELPTVTAKSFSKWQKDLLKHIRQDRPLVLFKSKAPKLTSTPGESEDVFRARLAQLAREERDAAVEKLRKKYASKVTTLQNRLQRAEQVTEREESQVKQRRMETAVNVGSALLSAVMGRKAVSRSTVSRASTSLKSAGRMQKEQQDVTRARETAATVREQLAALEAELETEVTRLSGGPDPSERLEQVLVKAKSSDVTLDAFALLWLPFRKNNEGVLSPDW